MHFDNFPYLLFLKFLDCRHNFGGFCSAGLEISFERFICGRTSPSPFDLLRSQEFTQRRGGSYNATINQATDAKLNQAIDSHEDQHNTPQKKAYPAWR